jgi:hypothetical protein
MLRTRTRHDEILVGPHRGISFQRTLRIPDDGGMYPLPPGLGRFPVRRRGEDILVPMYRREALWISFAGSWWRPSAVKIGVGGINAISGEPFDEEIRPGRQDYVVCPDQPWLDGINAGDGMIRQFVGVDLGQGASVEGQLTGREVTGGIQIVVIEPKAGLFSDTPPEREQMLGSEAVYACASGPPMGLGAGGRMRQEIFPDDYGWETWDRRRVGRAEIRLVGITEWSALTGEQPPPTPVGARAYTEAGLPWFDLYSERGDIPASQRLREVLSDEEMERRRLMHEYVSA